LESTSSLRRTQAVSSVYMSRLNILATEPIPRGGLAPLTHTSNGRLASSETKATKLPSGVSMVSDAQAGAPWGRVGRLGQRRLFSTGSMDFFRTKRPPCSSREMVSSFASTEAGAAAGVAPAVASVAEGVTTNTAFRVPLGRYVVMPYSLSSHDCMYKPLKPSYV